MNTLSLRFNIEKRINIINRKKSIHFFLKAYEGNKVIIVDNNVYYVTNNWAEA